jgi:(2Fe-2S) ferredoxin
MSRFDDCLNKIKAWKTEDNICVLYYAVVELDELKETVDWYQPDLTSLPITEKYEDLLDVTRRVHESEGGCVWACDSGGRVLCTDKNEMWYLSVIWDDLYELIEKEIETKGEITVSELSESICVSEQFIKTCLEELAYRRE